MKKVILCLFLCYLLLGISGISIAKDITYIRVQSTKADLTRNVAIILSPYIERHRHEKIGEISVTLENWGNLRGTLTEEILRRLMQKAALQGANAISELEIGSTVVVGYSHQEDVVERKLIVYGKALALKILPKEERK
jgi:hypothetical protein